MNTTESHHREEYVPKKKPMEILLLLVFTVDGIATYKK